MSTELDKAKKARTSAKGWAKRAKKALIDSISSYNANKDDDSFSDLDETMRHFDDKFSNLIAAQAAVEALLPEPDLEDEITREGAVHDEHLTVKKKAVRILKMHVDQKAQGITMSAKLPKIELQKFDGNIMEYAAWLQAYKATIETNKRLPDIEKFTYLKGLLLDEAAECIRGLSLTTENYKTAMDILDLKYGRKELHIFTHIQKLMELPLPTNQNSLTQVQELESKILVHIRSLESLGIKGETYGVILTPMILMRLPQNIRLEWARDCAGMESDLSHLLKFLREEISRGERSEMFKVPMSTTTTAPTGAQLTVHESNYQKTNAPTWNKKTPSGNACFDCGQTTHGIYKCPKFLSLSTVEKRRERVRQLNLCFKCLLPGHGARSCSKTCYRCKGMHNVLCCPIPENETHGTRKEERKEEIDESQQSTVATTLRPGSYCTLMPTAKVNVIGSKNRSVESMILLDSGADRTYISSDVVKQISPEFIGSETISYTAFGAPKPREDKRNKFSVCLASGNSTIRLEATEIPVICATMRRPSIPASVIDKLKELPLANPSLDSKNLKIDILIGIDQLWRILTDESPKRISDGIVAQKSVFGSYVVSGSSTWKTSNYTSSQMNCLSSTDCHVSKLWELDTIGINEVEMSLQEDFSKTLTFSNEDKRYVAGLTWKEDHPELQTNYFVAKKRLLSLTKRLEKNPDLAQGYEKVFEEMETDKIISEVPPEDMDSTNKIHYLTHRPVIRERSESTKIRPVFNASLKGANGVCLNDCIDPGPCLIPMAMDLLLRFRRWPVAVTGDIKKAFLQIMLDPRDRDVHRFLLWKDGLRIMRFNRVTFGVNASPFILNATIKHHLTHYDKEDRAVSELDENLFVDDFLSGANTEEEAKELVKETTRIMQDAGMTLTKFHSNKRLFEDPTTNQESTVLGVQWNESNDCFHYDGLDIPGLDTALTKRMLLSIIARFYDPFGFVMPFVMTLKILFQDCWIQELDWDEVLPNELYKTANKWLQDLPLVQSIKIRRPYSTDGNSNREWTAGGVQLHAFADASTRAYAGCVYITLPGPEPRESTLVIARARVAPLVKVTIPRLELLACLLTARTVNCVRKALKLDDSCMTHCYSDSTIALAWIKNSPEKWSPWISRRVIEIRNLTNPDDWTHVGTQDNIADLLTRGASASQIMDNTTWYNGPEFIRLDQPQIETSNSVSAEELSLTVSTESRVEELKSTNIYYDITNFSNLMKAVRNVAMVRRCVSNFKANAKRTEKTYGDLTVVELREAQDLLIKQAQHQTYPDVKLLLLDYCLIVRLLLKSPTDPQRRKVEIPRSSKIWNLSPYLDENGLLRKQTRLDQAELSVCTKAPIILPKGHLAKLITRYVHKTFLHSGVDTMITIITNSYWIIGLRSIAKNIEKGCIPCQKIDAKAFNEVAAPLPRDRIVKSPPFTITGVDYAGPLYAKDHEGKLYILLFTCAVTRAVHLELLDDLTTENFLLALRRLSARRSKPKVLYSDNAQTFKGAEAALVKHFGLNAPQWKYIVARSPWWGGWWERLVRSVKSALKKTLGKNALSRIQLETLLFEVESCINSRPLTFVGDTPDYRHPLTPNSFLGRNDDLDSIDDNEIDPITREELSEKERERLMYLNQCWNVWRNQYLLNLPTCVAKFGKKGSIEVGRVVLIYEDPPCRRQNWLLGIVTKLHFGKDSICRAADVRTVKGTRQRDIRKLFNLELNAVHPELLSSVEIDTEVVEVRDSIDDHTLDIANDTHDSDEDIEIETIPVRTSSGRVAKPRDILDI